MDTNAAHNLLNRTLATGWKVIEKIGKTAVATGGFFSVCYKVEKDGEICFLKAFDFAKFFDNAKSGKKVIDALTDMLNAYKYESKLSELCRREHITKVIFVKEAGEEIVNGYSISVVPYLIFDLADGDVRNKLHFSDQLDFIWRLKSLHSIAVGLKQLHNIDVSHQDLKPSNILVFQEESKIGDIGRSVCKNLSGPYDNFVFTGDWSYAPPEIMYGEYEKDWNKRMFATDCYALGSILVFYFTGVTMSALILNNIQSQFSWENWKGTFKEIEPYLIDAFELALNDFENSIKDEFLCKELCSIVKMLCFPIPSKRGHPANIRLVNGNQFNLERFITKFDVLYRQMRFRLIKT